MSLRTASTHGHQAVVFLSGRLIHGSIGLVRISLSVRLWFEGFRLALKAGLTVPLSHTTWGLRLKHIAPFCLDHITQLSSSSTMSTTTTAAKRVARSFGKTKHDADF